MSRKQIKLNSLDQLLPLLSKYPETQAEGINERIKLKEEIQSECDHEFINHGDYEVCNCGKTKLT